MQPNPGSSRINLPSRTRNNFVAAARAGARDMEDLEELEEISRKLGADKPKTASAPAGDRHIVRDRDGVKTIEIAHSEYELLVEVATLTDNFFDRLERTGAPVEQPQAWRLLRKRLETFRRLRSGNSAAAASVDAVLGLLNAERLLGK